MPNSLLRRLLGRAGADADGTSGSTFSLPGSLHPGARVLLLGSDDLLDLLFAMPLVQAMRSAVPDVSLGLVCDERTSHLALSTDRFADIVVVDEETIQASATARRALEEELGRDGWDVAILLGRRPDPARDELAYRSGADLRMGPDHPDAFPYLNCQVRPPASQTYPYDRAVLWGRLLGLALENAPVRWPLDPKRDRQMAQLVHFNKPRKQQRLIGIDPGIARGGTRLGATNMALIANHITRVVDSRTVILDADIDDPTAAELRSALDNAPLELPRPTLLETILLLGQCELFVCGNTDLMHFAVALGVPVLALFPEAEDDVWIPSRGEAVEVVRIVQGEALDLAALMDRVEHLLS